VNLVEPVIGSGTKAGYNFEITANTASTTSPATFSIGAVPTTINGFAQTGTRNFCVRTEGVIRFEHAQLGTQIAYDECIDGQADIFPLQ